MRFKDAVLFALAMCVVAAAFVIGVSACAQAQAANAPKIEAPETDFDFGTVMCGEKVEHSYELKNAGAADLDITEVRTSCGCTAAALEKTKLKPGETTNLKVVYTASMAPGPVKKSITIKSNDPARPALRLTIGGTVKAYVEVIPRSLNIGDVEPDSRTTRKVYVKPLNKEGFKVTKVVSSLPYIKADIGKAPSPETGTWSVSVTVGPGLPPARCRGTLTIYTTDPKQPRATVLVYANVIEPPK